MQKDGHEINQDHSHALRLRQRWFNRSIGLRPERRAFIDETLTVTNKICNHGRRSTGDHTRVGLPHGHRKKTAVVTRVSMTGMLAVDCARRSDQRQLGSEPTNWPGSAFV